MGREGRLEGLRPQKLWNLMMIFSDHSSLQIFTRNDVSPSKFWLTVRLYTQAKFLKHISETKQCIIYQLSQRDQVTNNTKSKI